MDSLKKFKNLIFSKKGLMAITIIVFVITAFYFFGPSKGDLEGGHPVLDTAAVQLAEDSNFKPYRNSKITKVIYSDLITSIADGTVAAVSIEERPYQTTITARMKNGEVVETSVIGNSSAHKELRAQLGEIGIPYGYDQHSPSNWFMWFFVIAIAIFLFFMIKGMRSGGGAGGEAMKFGKSKHNVVEYPTEGLEHVAVADITKINMEELIARLGGNDNHGSLGSQMHKGFIFTGPPGTGKTALARAIAGELSMRAPENSKKVGILTISGSDFVEMLVGVGAARVRDMFEQAAKNAPCIIFIDEIDAIAGKRSADGIGGSKEGENTLNQLLVQLDGFNARSGIVVIGATNRKDMLDDAILREGRLGKEIHVPLPDPAVRTKILEIHALKMQKRAFQDMVEKGQEPTSLPEIFSDDVIFSRLAYELSETSGADIAGILNEAAILAEREEASCITLSHIRDAFQTSKIGDKMPRELLFWERLNTAIHEILGHALIGAHMHLELGNMRTPAIKAVTIEPRGRALGFVWYAYLHDAVSQTTSGMLSRLCTIMGGRVAEDLFMEPTTGASNDIDQATEMAEAMVGKLGLWSSSDKPPVFRNYYKKTQMGESLVSGDIINPEVDKLLSDRLLHTEALLLSYLDKKTVEGNNLMEVMARTMVIHGTLQGEEFMKLVKGEELYPLSELHLGDDEEEFVSLWGCKAKAKHRQERKEFLIKSHPEIAKEYNLAD